MEINRSQEPIRLFRSDLLEAVTHIHHMLHHFKTPHQRFGASSLLWDIVFRTKPA